MHLLVFVVASAFINFEFFGIHNFYFEFGNMFLLSLRVGKPARALFEIIQESYFMLQSSIFRSFLGHRYLNKALFLASGHATPLQPGVELLCI